MAPTDDGSALPAWLRSFIDRRLEREKVWFIGLVILGMNLALAAVSFLTFDGTYTIFGPAPGSDFAGFYAAGRILNEHGPQGLYDLELQDRVFHQVLPGLPAEAKLPYIYPPFFSLLFRPLARMPYTWACLIWMLFTAGLYLGGLALIWGSRRAIPAREGSTAVLLALSFQPFLDCWLSGQTSAFGFAAAALAMRCESRNMPLGVGLSLSLCLYKPPLLFVILPMIAVARRWRVLGGFAAGGLALAGISVLAIGRRGCLGYLDHLTAFSRIARAPSTEFPNWKFVDLDHFFGSLFGGHGAVRFIVLVGVALAVLPSLARLWWAFDRAGADRRMLTWSATLTWTLVLNLYIGVYDVILIVAGLLITADVLYQCARGTATALTPAFKSLLALLYVVPWFSQHLARVTGFQPFTLILIAMGTYQLALAWRERPDGRRSACDRIDSGWSGGGSGCPAGLRIGSDSPGSTWSEKAEER
jgi:hypothetical protein